jgi:hypothetical protein
MSRHTLPRLVLAAALLGPALVALPVAASAPSCLGLPATVVGTSASETLTGTEGDDVVHAGGGNDVVRGLGGDDTICGANGDDVLEGGLGDDRLSGGAGVDAASYVASATPVTASLATRAATGEGTDAFTGLENLVGSRFADRLSGDDAANAVEGGAGTDTCTLGKGADSVQACEAATSTYGPDGTVESFTFVVTPAAAMYLRVAGPNGRLSLTGPSGQLIINQPTRHVTDAMTLSSPGIYTATVTSFLYDGYDYTVSWTRAPAAQVFDYTVGQPITSGSPRGAGNLEKPGSADLYRFAGVAGQRVYPLLTPVRFLGQPAFCPDLTLTDPTGTELLPGPARCGAAGLPSTVTLPVDGVYTLGVRSGARGHVGTYALTLQAAPRAQRFTYVPGTEASAAGAGAGTLERPGSVDEYRFTGAAGQRAYLYGSQPRLTITAPNGAAVVPSTPAPGYPAVVVLPQTGRYVLQVSSGEAAVTGTYRLRLYPVPPEQTFAYNVGDPISDDVPGPGAGYFSGPEAVDRYLFEASLGQSLLVQAAGLQAYGVQTPAGRTISRRGNTLYVPTVTGRHQLVFGPSDPMLPDLHYTARIDVVTAPEVFAYTSGTTVSDGVPAPGAGRVESPGAQDWYTFDGAAGQTVTMSWQLSGRGLRWQLVTSDGATVVAPTGPVHRVVTLPSTGSYVVQILPFTAADVFVGPYAFRLS